MEREGDSEDTSEKLPNTCGIVQYSLPIADNLYSLLLDDGLGNKKTVYYYHQKGSAATNCGDIVGMLCYEIVQKIPVPQKLRESGVRGQTMTIVNQCVAAD